MAYDRCKPLQGSSSRRRSKGRQSGYEPHKRGLNTKIHLAVDSSGMPVRAIITEGTRADCKEAIHLIEGIDAQNLLADRGYDTSEIVAFALSAGINVVIPPKKNRKEQREYDRYLYKIRHLVENAFLWLKRWRGIATRYADGNILYLPELYTDSSNLNAYTHPKWIHLPVSEAKEVTDGDEPKSKAQCYAEMRKAAQTEFDAGCDLTLPCAS